MLKVPPKTALRYVEDHTDCRYLEEGRLRVRTCPDPRCGHAKWGVTFNAQLQVFYCFRHSGVYTFLDFVKEQIGSTSNIRVMEELASYGDLEITWGVDDGRDERTRIDALREMLEGVEEDEVRQPPTFLEGWTTDWSSEEGLEILDYALRRKVPPWFVALGRVGYMPDTRMRRRMVFLVVEDGRPVYTVGRSISDWLMPKYLYPLPAETEGFGASDYVFNLDLLGDQSVGVLCEGPLSALSAGVGGIASLGKTLSDTQAEKISRKCDLVLQLREEGVPKEIVEENAKKLWSRGVQVFTADLEGGDTNDNPDQMNSIHEKAKPATKGSWLMSKLEGAIFRE